MRKIILIVSATLLLTLAGCGYTEEDISAARNEGYREGYDKGYESGEYDGRENMMDILWSEGEDALSGLYLGFCCPNCKAELEFLLDEGVYVQAYAGTRDHPGYYRGYHINIEYQY